MPLNVGVCVLARTASNPYFAQGQSVKWVTWALFQVVRPQTVEGVCGGAQPLFP